MKRPFIITTLTSVAILILNIGTGIITARALGPSGKGILRTLIIWPTIFSQIAILGANEAYIYLKNNRLPQKELLSSVFFTVLFSSIMSGVLTFIIIYVTVGKKYTHSPMIPFLSMLYLPVANIVQTALSIMQEELKFLKYNLLRFLLPVVYLLLLFTNYNHLTPEKCFTYLIMANLLLLVFSFNTFKNVSLSSVQRRIISRIMNFGIKTQLTNIMSSFSQQTDQAILSLIAPSSSLGIYSVAASISKIGFLAPNAAQIVLYPLLSKGKITAWKKYFFYLSLLNGLLLAFLFVSIKPLIILLYGRAFISAAELSLILFLTAFPVSLINVGTAYFKAKGKPFTTTKAQFIIFLSILILAPLSYHIMQLKGMAIAIVASYIAGALYYIFAFKNREHTECIKTLGCSGQ